MKKFATQIAKRIALVAAMSLLSAALNSGQAKAETYYFPIAQAADHAAHGDQIWEDGSYHVGNYCNCIQGLGCSDLALPDQWQPVIVASLIVTEEIDNSNYGILLDLENEGYAWHFLDNNVLRTFATHKIEGDQWIWFGAAGDQWQWAISDQKPYATVSSDGTITISTGE